jgi:hypothetical protein
MTYLGNTPTTQSFISGTDYFNGTGSQTAFTLSRTVASINDIQVTVNNVVQQPNDAYTISGTTLTMTSAPSAGTNNVYVRYLSTTTQAITPSQGTVSWNTLDSNVQGDLGISFKNRIINGAMVIDQRNAGASVTPTNGNGEYTVDRWAFQFSQASKFTVQQNAGSVTPPVGFTNYLGITSSSAYSIGANDYFTFYQPIEGLNISDLGWGTANAKTVTLSFWVRSSLTGTFGGALGNSGSGGARSYPFSYSISAANTWEQKTITIAGDTSGTWLTTNGWGIAVQFGFGVGSTYSETAGAWVGTLEFSATGATSVVGTNGATFYITGVQLEVGTQATTFTTAGGSYGAELALCQRYFWRNKCGGAGASLGVGYLATATIFRGYAQFPVAMRSAPTFTINTDGGNLIINTATANIAITTISGGFSTDSGTISLDMGSSGTAGQGAVVYAAGGSANAAYLQFSSEL